MDRIHDRLLLWGALRKAPRVLVAVLGLTLLVQALLPAASAVAVAAIVGGLHGGGGPHLPDVWGPLAVFVAILLLGHGLDAVVVPLRFVVKQEIDGAFRGELAELAVGLDVADVELPETQDLIRLASADPQNWADRTPGDGGTAQLALTARYIGMVGACAVLIRYSPWLIPALLIPAVIAREFRRHDWLSINRLRRSRATQGRWAGYWRETATSPGPSRELRVFGFGDWVLDRIQLHIHTMFDPLWAHGRRAQAWQTVQFLVMAVPLAAVYAVVAAADVHGHTTLATETAVLSAGWAVFAAVAPVTDAFDTEWALPSVQAAQQVRELAATRSVGEPDRRGPRSGATWQPRPDGRPPLVELTEVRFSYPGTQREVLAGLDLQIRPGELLAMVGLNGTGKSTLIKLLAGLYAPTSGRLTADGQDLSTLEADSWRAGMFVVFQDFVQYHLSAADNIVLGNARRQRDDRALAAAAVAAGFDGVLDRLPAGLQTPLGRDRSGGVDLSGGQWQQAVLARALYALEAGARILVLDEPTAHLDVRTESEVFDKLAARAGAATVVLISHRLSTVRRADRIAMLADGRITECGSHEELMALDGGYAEMFRIQAERFRRGFDDRLEETA